MNKILGFILILIALLILFGIWSVVKIIFGCNHCTFENQAHCKFPCYICFNHKDRCCMGCINPKRKSTKLCADPEFRIDKKEKEK